MDIKVTTKIDPSLVKFLPPSKRAELHTEIGLFIKEFTADHIGEASVDRHKTADRLGASHTKYLEFAVGRVGTVKNHFQGPMKAAYIGQNPVPTVNSTRGTVRDVTIDVTNADGLLRAYGPVTIRPQSRKFLTIPIHALAYGRKAGEMESLGYKTRVARTKKSGLLIMGERKGGDPIALYALKASVTLPQDRGLMPSDQQLEDWAGSAADAWLELEASGG